jgi:proteasome accessory factor C
VSAAPRSSAGTSTTRLQRLLALVPYVVSRKVVGLAETAAAFGVSERELVDDLNLLWCVELRSPDPYCPIDLSYEGGEIVVSQAESMDRPLRLAVDGPARCSWRADAGRDRRVAAMPSADGGQARTAPRQAEAAAGSRHAAHPGGHPGGPDPWAGRPGPAPGRPSRRRRNCICRITSGPDRGRARRNPMRLLIVAYLEGWCRRGGGQAVPPGPGAGPGRLSAAEVPADAEPGTWTRDCSASAGDLSVVVDLAAARPVGRGVLSLRHHRGTR